jgi:CelD/BcsL family acetyltransferase involved in cellulose biosynthesis
MRATLITQLDELQAIVPQWRALRIPSPMQAPEWILSWWKQHDAQHRQLAVMAVWDDDQQLQGLALWYVQNGVMGRELRWIGDGAACSDHATLLHRDGLANAVVSAMAKEFIAQAGGLWSRAVLEAANDHDECLQLFFAKLRSTSIGFARRPALGTCTIDLPTTWDAYLSLLSKNHRKRCRQWERRYFETKRVETAVARDPESCSRFWNDLLELHQARRGTFQQSGAFAEARLRDFHVEAMEKLAATHQVQLRVLRFEGQPVACEYLLCDEHCWYAYQSGLSDAGAEISAGSLSLQSLIRDAIAEGIQRVDLLRGTEPYKFHWGARHIPASTHLLYANNVAGRVTSWVDHAVGVAKQWKQYCWSPAESVA